MEVGKRIIAPTPEFWKGVQRKLGLILALVGGLHGAVEMDQLPFLAPYTDIFILIEVIIPILMGQAQMTKK